MTQTPPILELRDVDTFYGPVQAHFGYREWARLFFKTDQARDGFPQAGRHLTSAFSSLHRCRDTTDYFV